MFGATSIVKKKSDKQNYVYSGSGIVFDRKSDTAKNVVIFGIDNSWSSRTSVNLKNNILVLGEGNTSLLVLIKQT